MNYLEEKGISNDFAEKLVDLSTNYEHTAYISLLEALAKFTAAKWLPSRTIISDRFAFAFFF